MSGRRLTDLSYEAWLEHAFGHEVRHQQLEWYFDDDCDWWAPAHEEAVAYLTRLFEDPEPALEFFSDAQIAQGLNYLVNTMAVGDDGHLYDRGVPLEARRRCVAATAVFFAKIFARRCAPVLSHFDEQGAGPLNGVCYMWWDVFPCVALADDPHRGEMHQAVLQTLRRILSLDCIACQESALHGLGHWCSEYPQAVAVAIDSFLAASPNLPPKLVTYARAARSGCVQ
jgi:hypothetical protein